MVTEIATEKKVHPLKVRFSDAQWFDRAKDTTILLLGSGGIGSWVGFALARIGFPIMVHDFDLVEDHNLGGQLFTTQQVNKQKTVALEEVCKLFSGNEVKIYRDGKYTEDSGSNEIVIAAFDNMAARKLAFDKWVELLNEADEKDKDNFLFLDGRLLAEDYRVYAVTKDRVEAYRKTLFTDDVVDNIQCTLKSTTHCSMAIASEIVSLLTNHVANIQTMQDYGAHLRELPAQIVKSIHMFTHEISNEIECLTSES